MFEEKLFFKCVKILQLTYFKPMFCFYTPWKEKNPERSDAFREYKNGTLA